MCKKIKKELNFYKKIGIPLFRKLLMKYELFRHRKDGLRNKNYHLEQPSQDGLKRFTGYLLYNTVLHILSILFTALYFIARFCMNSGGNILDIIMSLVTVFNVYCILLQRYNYLRMKIALVKYCEYKEKQLEKQAAVLLEAFPKEYSFSQMEEDVKVLAEMKSNILRGKDYFVTPKEAEQFRRMSHLLNQSTRIQKMKQEGSQKSTYQPGTKVYGKVEKRVNDLQKFLKWKKSERILSIYSVVTIDNECEEAFQSLFSQNSKDSILERIELLEKVINAKMTGRGSNER